MTRARLLAALLVALAGTGPAVAGVCDPDAPLALSRLWDEPPAITGAGEVGAALRGWSDGRRRWRAGRDETRHGYLALPWRLPEGDDGPLALALGETVSGGALAPRTIDDAALRAAYPATDAQDLLGGDRRYFHRLRAEVFGSPGPRCTALWLEGIDERSAQTALGAGREERSSAPRLSANLTWQPRAVTRFTLGARWDALSIDDAGLSAWDLPSAARDRASDQLAVVATARHQLGPRAELGAAYDLTSDRDDWTAAAGLAVPGHLNLDNYVGWGNYPWTRRARSLRQRGDLHLAAFVDGDLVTHTVTAGVQGEHLAADEDETRNGGFTYVDVLPTDPMGAPVDRFAEADRSSWELYASDRGDELHVNARQSQAALYLEDRLQLGGAITVTPGVRGERHQGGFAGGATAWTTWTASPRLAVDARLGVAEATALYLRAGRHHQRLDPSFYRRARAGAAYTPLEYWSWTGDPMATPPGRDDPAWALDRSFDPVLADVDPDVRHPYVDRLVAGARHTIAERFELGVRYELRRSGALLGLIDRRFAEGAYLERERSIGAGPDDSFRYYELPEGERPAYLVTNPAGARRTAHQLRLDTSLDLTRWLLVRGALELTWDRGNLDSEYGLSEEWRDPSGTINAQGDMPGSDRVRGWGEAVLDLPLGVRAYADYTFGSGQYHARLLRVQPATGPRVFVYDGRGRGGYRYPARHVVDLRVDRALPLPGAGRWLGAIDVHNLLAADTVTGFRETTSYFRAVSAVERPFEILVEVRYAY